MTKWAETKERRQIEGARLRYILRRLGWSVGDVADGLGIPAARLNQMLCGHIELEYHTIPPASSLMGWLVDEIQTIKESSLIGRKP